MILCIGATPAVQRVMVFRRVVLDAVNRAVTTLDGVAGKAVNVAKVLKALGAEPAAIGFWGGDRAEFLRATLEAKGIGIEFVTVAARTRQCITVIDESTGAVTELVEESCPVATSDYEALLAVIQRRSRGCQAAVMSGTLTPGAPADFYRRCTELAQEAGALAVVDAQGAPLVEALKAQPDLVKPNRGELAATLGEELKDEAAVIRAMQDLSGRGARRVVVTAGKGPVLASDGAQLYRVTPPKVAAVNPIGSGDSFTAGLVRALVRGDSLGEACRCGAAAGAANALELMPGELNPTEVNRLALEVNVELLPGAAAR
jgi:tagatose 6-phosphate kinase